MTEREMNEWAIELLSWLEDAVWDVAACCMSDPEWKSKAKKAKVKLTRDWLADELYSDPEEVWELLGDRIWDVCKGDNDTIIAFCKIIEGRGSSAVKRAMRKAIEKYSNC